MVIELAIVMRKSEKIVDNLAHQTEIGTIIETLVSQDGTIIEVEISQKVEAILEIGIIETMVHMGTGRHHRIQDPILSQKTELSARIRGCSS